MEAVLYLPRWSRLLLVGPLRGMPRYRRRSERIGSRKRRRQAELAGRGGQQMQRKRTGLTTVQIRVYNYERLEGHLPTLEMSGSDAKQALAGSSSVDQVSSCEHQHASRPVP